ncbi:MAG TPA: hypothetical protein VKH19_07555 [Gemmatimonadaceae bacterium]|nr:hypothetical protein [Gemmatimonadaceae bacterium]
MRPSQQTDGAWWGSRISHGGNVDSEQQEKNRNLTNLTVVRGGKSSVRGRRRGRRVRTAAETMLDSVMHAASVRIQTPKGTTPSTGWEDIRRLRQFPWRVPARRIIEARQGLVPVERVVEWIDALRDWTLALYDGDRSCERSVPEYRDAA